MAAPPLVTLLHGDDDLRIEEELDKLRAAMGPDGEFNTEIFDGTSADVPQILAAAQAFPFLADTRLVIVKDFLAHTGRKGAGETGKRAIEKMAEAVAQLPDTTRLVFVERETVGEKHKLYTAIKGVPNSADRLYKTPTDSTDWIQKRARDVYGVAIDPMAAAALASVTPGDLRRADNELCKLAAYVDGARPISEADVALLTPYVAEANMFNMIDALAAGRGAEVVRLIDRLMTDQKEDYRFAIYGSIVSQFRKLLIARAYMDQHGTGDQAGLKAALDTGSDFVVKKVSGQARQFDRAALEAIYIRLHEYDTDMKIGRITPRLAVDLLVAGLARR